MNRLAALALALMVAVAPGWAGPDEAVGLEVGQYPPAMSGEDLDGTTHTLAEHRGKVVVLHFWASWCPFCRGEIPELAALHEQDGVVVLTVNIEQDAAKIAQWSRQAALPYPVILDVNTDFVVSSRYRVSAIPVTYVIGRDGRITHRFAGSSDITSAVQQVLTES